MLLCIPTQQQSHGKLSAACPNISAELRNAVLPILTGCCDATDGKVGLELIREMFANATKWKMNTVRIYAHTTDPSHPFMVSACFLAVLEYAHCLHPPIYAHHPTYA